MAYDQTNTGILFINDKKPEGSKQPDRRGTINVNGTDYDLAGWIKEGKNGKSFLSLKVSIPREKGQQQERQQRPESEEF